MLLELMNYTEIWQATEGKSVQEATVQMEHDRTNWLQIDKKVKQTYIESLPIYSSYILNITLYGC